MSPTTSAPLLISNVGAVNGCWATYSSFNSWKQLSCPPKKEDKQWWNPMSRKCSKSPVCAEQLQMCGNSMFALGMKVKRGWGNRERAKVAAMVQNTSDNGVKITGETRAAALRRILASTGVHQGPACYDALSARLVEQAGFSYTFMSGFAVSAVRLGAPDVGLLSYGEVLEQGRIITSAVFIPVIGDGDTGYGNALNVKRTVKGFIQAGFAGILIEDQVSPKSCGHFGGKEVVSRDEAVMRIRAAVDARSESQGDIVIVARSDARQAESLEEALWRVQQFAGVGADVVFIDALASKDEMLAFCKVAPNTPKMANMLEGGGRTPILSPQELEEVGFKLVAYPLSLVGVSIRAMQDALKALKSGRLPPPGHLPSFDEIKEVVGINHYYEEDKNYALQELPASLASNTKTPDASVIPETTQSLPADILGDAGVEGIPILDGDVVRDIPDILGTPGTPEDSVFVNPDIVEDKDTSSNPSPLAAVWSRVLRIKITGRDGNVKVDVRIPITGRKTCQASKTLRVDKLQAGFLEGLANIIPGVAGLNLQKLLDDAIFKLRGNLDSGQQLLNFTDRRGDQIEVFLE